MSHDDSYGRIQSVLGDGFSHYRSSCAHHSFHFLHSYKLATSKSECGDIPLMPHCEEWEMCADKLKRSPHAMAIATFRIENVWLWEGSSFTK